MWKNVSETSTLNWRRCLWTKWNGGRSLLLSPTRVGRRSSSRVSEWVSEVSLSMSQWHRSVIKEGSRSVRSNHQTVSVQDSERTQAPRKISFTFHFCHKSFVLRDVKLAELSNNSFEWKKCDILGGAKHILTPSTYFHRLGPQLQGLWPCTELHCGHTYGV